jgi:predicted nucleic acid-binding protein
MLVIDASAACDLLLRSPRSAAIARVLASPDESLHAPSIFPAECLNVARRRYLRQELAAADVDRFITELYELDIEHHDLDVTQAQLMPALFPNVTTMDAAYVTLAQQLGATLVTLDDRLAEVASRRCDVITFR